jgi:hypothetical protein
VFGCKPPLPFNSPFSPNKFSVTRVPNGFILGIHATNSWDKEERQGAIDSTFFIQASSSAPAIGAAVLEPFPSAQLYQFQGNRVTELLNFEEDALGPDWPGWPDLNGKSQVIPFTRLPVP